MTRLKLAKIFNMRKSSGPIAVTQNGQTKIESDGYTIEDLKKISVSSMQDYLGFAESDDLFTLFQMCVDKAEGRKIHNKTK